MKTLIFLFISFLFSAHAFANSKTELRPEMSKEVQKDCFNMSDEALICTYKGKTGLELFPEVELHNVQRISVYLKGGLGSIVLISDAKIEGLTFKECWSISHILDKDLLLFCKQDVSPLGTIPEVILNEIENLRAN